MSGRSFYRPRWRCHHQAEAKRQHQGKQDTKDFGFQLLNLLCIDSQAFSFDPSERIDISTQETIEKGILDIRIHSPSKLIYVEVKDYAPVQPEQLQKYREELDSAKIAVKQLILLTRFPIDKIEHKDIPHKCVRWNEVHRWLEKVKANDSVSTYLMQSFRSFLEEK
jgi:hypothetical protein